MKRLQRAKPHHRRDWRRLWLRCRCGFRWRCPDSIELVPMPYQPTVPPLDRATYRAAYRATVRELAPLLAAPDAPPPPARTRATNQRTAGPYPDRASQRTAARYPDRARYLTSIHPARTRHAERVPG